MEGKSCVVIRDNNGMILAISNRWHDLSPDVLTAEAYACRDGAKLIRHMNISEFIMKSDPLELVLLWKTRNTHRASILPVLK
jgi:hypothetical protein